MHKKKLVSFAAMMLLVGGGCANYDNTGSAPEEAASANEASSAPTESAEMPSGDIYITKAEPQGNRTLLVEFTTSKEAAGTSEGYRLLLSGDEEPTWPTKGYWYQLGPAHTMKEWKGLPLGERQLRACVVENDVCTSYSQTMTVEIE